MANAKENKEFGQAILPQWPLDEAISWIQNNMEPEDVFTDEKLTQWAEDSGYVKGEE